MIHDDIIAAESIGPTLFPPGVEVAGGPPAER
jgi:hypothetical protein